MSGPALNIDLEKIEKNARAIVSLCRGHGITVAGVTKGVCGMPQVARAMVRGGVSEIGESRLENIHRLAASGVSCSMILLRIPPLSEVDEIVASVDISLNSELSVIEELSRTAEKRGIVHRIILMIDLGDLREGIWPDDLLPLAGEVVELPGVRIVGIGTNLTCYGGVIPTRENMEALVENARSLEATFDLKLRYISGGNSSSLPLLASGQMPEEINHLRIGEAILLGRETVHRQPWPGTFQDAFLLSAELIELKEKPSLPIGEIGEDAFGGKTDFPDRGIRMRGILNVGREDAAVEGLRPVQQELSILGASSDHLLIDVTDAEPALKLGDRPRLQLNYAALLVAMTSSYVEKKAVLGPGEYEPATGIWLGGEPEVIESFKQVGIREGLMSMGDQVLEQEASAHSISIRRIACGAEQALKGGQTPLILGADHRVTVASLLASSRQLDAFGLIWFDALADFLPPDIISGNRKRRSVLSTALGYGRFPPFPELKSHLSPENITIIGLRKAETQEAALLQHSRIRVFTMEDIDNMGIKEVVRQGLRRAASGTRGLHVSFCFEVVDRLVSKASVGGFTLREAHLAMEMIAGSGLLRSMDAVGLEPAHELDRFRTATEFILSAFGKRILGR